MSSFTAALTKQVGPMPLGAWLLVGAGGLWIAYRSQNGGAAAPAPATGDPLPTGGGYPPTGGAVGSYDGAPVVLSPIFRIPAPKVDVRVTVPSPATTPTPATTPPPPTPTVPAKPAPKPAARPVVTYTIRSGDTLWSIAARILGSGYKWPTVYAQNRATIEAAAKRHGRSSSAGGWWIYPGTVLRITK